MHLLLKNISWLLILYAAYCGLLLPPAVHEAHRTLRRILLSLCRETTAKEKQLPCRSSYEDMGHNLNILIFKFI